MRKIEFTASIGWAGCSDEQILEVDDNTTDAELDQMANEIAQEHAASWEGDERLMSEEEWSDPNEVENFYQNADCSWKEVDND